MGRLSRKKCCVATLISQIEVNISLHHCIMDILSEEEQLWEECLRNFSIQQLLKIFLQFQWKINTLILLYCSWMLYLSTLYN